MKLDEDLNINGMYHKYSNDTIGPTLSLIQRCHHLYRFKGILIPGCPYYRDTCQLFRTLYNLGVITKYFSGALIVCM